MPHRTALPILALLLGAAGAPSASAQTVWSCWYNQQQQVACLLQSAAQVSAASEAAVPAGVPPSLTVVRNQPSTLRGRAMLIPLYNEPFDTSALAELAQAVMCGPQPGCRVVYGGQPADTPESAASFADANDPLLQGDS
jgi:hypothetical protein